MERLTIEKADRRRYRLLVWQTIGFALFFAAFIFFPDGGRLGDIPVIDFIRGLGVGLGLAATFKLSHFEREIKDDSSVAGALDNEMYRMYDRKALVCGFYVSMLTAFVLFVLDMASLYTGLTAGIIMYAGLVSSRVAKLIYYR